MPAKSKSQQKLFSMALAVRHGELKRSDVDKSVLEIVDSDMTDSQIKHFTVTEGFKPTKLSQFINQRYSDRHLNDFNVDYNPNYVFVVIKPGCVHLTSTIISKMKKNGFFLYKIRPKQLTLSEAKSLYSVHKDEDFYNELCKYMSSGVSVGLLLTTKKKDKFKALSKIKEEIREKYSESEMRNVMHSSDNDERMHKEMLKYFSSI